MRRSLLLVLSAAAVVLFQDRAAGQLIPPPWLTPETPDRAPVPPGSQAEPPTPTPVPAPRPPRAAPDRSSGAPPTPRVPGTRAPEPTAGSKPSQAADVFSCSGTFARDSTHQALVGKFNAANVTYGPVDAPDGGTFDATILFPHEPRRRLEVIWTDDTSRRGIAVVAITGQSRWAAPKGLRLGLTLAALEKINGRAFRISGLRPDGSASVLSWNNGELTILPGGCKVGMRLVVDGKASETARRSLIGDKGHLSSDKAVRDVMPTVAELLIGY